MKSVKQAKALPSPTVAEMLESIAADYAFLTPDGKRKLGYGIEMVFHAAKKLADAEQQKILVVLGDEYVGK